MNPIRYPTIGHAALNLAIHQLIQRPPVSDTGSNGYGSSTVTVAKKQTRRCSTPTSSNSKNQIPGGKDELAAMQYTCLLSLFHSRMTFAKLPC